MVTLREFFRIFRRLSTREAAALEQIAEYCSQEQLQQLKKLVKLKRAEIKTHTHDFGYTKVTHPSILSHTELEEERVFIEKINNTTWKQQQSVLFDDLKNNAYEIIPRYIAPNIVGLDAVKQAATLQLFSKEQLHILLLGDPSTGKTDILRSVADASPISSLGLGSGTTGSGLAVTIQGDTVKKGLLPLAHEGVCCIDELNLMDKKDAASLYNAMEKGFVRYDKGGHHVTFDAKVRIVATANPKGDDRFTGTTIAELKKQIPFDSALLSRFHLVFIIRKPNEAQFKQISQKIIKGVKTSTDPKVIEVVREYIAQTHAIDPEIPKELEQEISEFMGWLKKTDATRITEVSPRNVVGFVRLAKASARMESRSQINKSDIKRVKQLILDSFKVD